MKGRPTRRFDEEGRLFCMTNAHAPSPQSLLRGLATKVSPQISLYLNPSPEQPQPKRCRHIFLPIAILGGYAAGLRQIYTRRATHSTGMALPNACCGPPQLISMQANATDSFSRGQSIRTPCLRDACGVRPNWAQQRCRRTKQRSTNVAQEEAWPTRIRA